LLQAYALTLVALLSILMAALPAEMQSANSFHQRKLS
jgi:hypothetical protein